MESTPHPYGKSAHFFLLGLCRLRTQSARFASYVRARLPRYSRGDWPVTFLKTRLNCESDRKPTSKATSLIRNLGFCKRLRAFSTRERATCSTNIVSSRISDSYCLGESTRVL